MGSKVLEGSGDVATTPPLRSRYRCKVGGGITRIGLRGALYHDVSLNRLLGNAIGYTLCPSFLPTAEVQV